MILKTAKFGKLEINTEKIITFKDGILGFPEIHKFIILEHDRDVPFKWMQALDDPNIAFVIMDPFLVDTGYKPVISDEDLSSLGGGKVEDFIVMSIVTVPSSNPADCTINLQGPLIVNDKTMLGKQIVLIDGNYSCSTPIMPQSLNSASDPAQILNPETEKPNLKTATH